MSIPFKKLQNHQLGLTSTFTKGKLKGKKVGECIRQHSPYIIWAEENSVFEFTDVVIQMALAQIDVNFMRDLLAEELRDFDDVPY